MKDGALKTSKRSWWRRHRRRATLRTMHSSARPEMLDAGNGPPPKLLEAAAVAMMQGGPAYTHIPVVMEHWRRGAEKLNYAIRDRHGDLDCRRGVSLIVSIFQRIPLPLGVSFRRWPSPKTWNRKVRDRRDACPAEFLARKKTSCAKNKTRQ